MAQRKKGRSANSKSLGKPTNHRANGQVVIGKSVNSGVISWKGADLTVARYVGRVAVGTTADEIKSSLVDNGVDVIS